MRCFHLLAFLGLLCIVEGSQRRGKPRKRAMRGIRKSRRNPARDRKNRKEENRFRSAAGSYFKTTKVSEGVTGLAWSLEEEQDADQMRAEGVIGDIPCPGEEVFEEPREPSEKLGVSIPPAFDRPPVYFGVELGFHRVPGMDVNIAVSRGKFSLDWLSGGVFRVTIYMHPLFKVDFRWPSSGPRDARRHLVPRTDC
jgi:hypothetical protein